MTEKLLVTVLMTVYNGGEYLKTSIKSILDQSYKDFEFLIINDCSTDNFVEIIKSFSDDRIVIHNNECNLGQTKSLNAGLKLARGKYVARMDADDMAYPLWLEKILNYIIKNPEYAAVGAAAIVIDSKGKKKEIRRSPVNFHGIMFRIFFAPPMNHVSVILNKDIILKSGGYDENFRITQDYELWSNLIRNKLMISNIPDILVAYRVHTSSAGFVEANKKGLDEKSETVLRNVNFLTELTIKYDDAREICKLFYHTAELSSKEFENARKNFENIYLNLKEGNKIPLLIYKKGIKIQMLKPYCKLAVYNIQNGNIKEGQKLMLEYLELYGFNIMPFIILIFTFTGYGLSKKLPLMYEKWRETRAKLIPGKNKI